MAPDLQRPVRELWSLVWLADETMIPLSCQSREDALQTAWDLRAGLPDVHRRAARGAFRPAPTHLNGRPVRLSR
jgi:hypothetical protein